MTPTPVSYIELVRTNRHFRRVWFGEVVSLFGDWFSTIALFAIVQDVTGSALAVAAVLVAQTLPGFLVTPWTGPLVDRYDRRMLMVVADVGRALAVLGLIAAHHLESLPLLYALTAVVTAFSGLFSPANTAVIPEICSEEEMPAAMALAGGTWSAMLALGAAAGGLVTAFVGVDGALLLDALTFLGSAALLVGLPALPPPEESEDEGDRGFLAGVRYLVRHPHVQALGTLKLALTLASAQLVALPFYGDGRYPATAGPLFVGLLYAARGVGSVVGSMGVRAVVGDADETLRGGLAGAFALIALGTAGGAMSPTVAWAALGFFVASFGMAMIWVFSNILLLRVVEPAYRGRVFSAEFGLMTLATAAVTAGGGALMDHAAWSAGDVMWGSAAVAVGAGGVWVPWVRRTAAVPEGV